MKWEIDKTFEFCYGHRVWTQVLNSEFSDNLKCACRHRHGHEASVQVYLSSNDLDNTGMVTDFRHLEWLKRFFNEYVDHKFIVDKHDPAFEKLVGYNKKLIEVCISGTDFFIGWKLDLSTVDNNLDIELDEGILVVDFVPTSENLSKWVLTLVQAKMEKLNIYVSRVDWWETPKSRSSYFGVE